MGDIVQLPARAMMYLLLAKEIVDLHNEMDSSEALVAVFDEHINVCLVSAFEEITKYKDGNEEG